MDQRTRDQLRAIQSDDEAQKKAEQLPSWVKCLYCGGRPKVDDWLGEVVPNSSALAHQSCMKARGKIFGLNAGTLQEIGGSIKPVGGDQS